MEPITTFTGKAIALPIQDVDTDQIIPARYLKVTSKAGLGEALFADWRYDADGNPKPEFILNQPHATGAEVLIAGRNFGCGSSREHAPWALTGFGFKAVISTSFANIFHNNSLQNGLLPIEVDEETYHLLVSLCEEDPETQLQVDLATQTVTLPDGQTVGFPIDGFAKTCLLEGVDQLGYLLKQVDTISTYEATNPGKVTTVG